ncbi:Small ubiquitin- modifier 2-A [Clonorchis sinensis]|uniref:Small ubiquitin-related modifier n=1 Tax=Clonorchis sinensis TaxID=79923 RepID=A0A3R7CE04_CLOSI|nr:Small ubiquitin- modifier 2-A [Clonorchis sinensis]
MGDSAAATNKDPSSEHINLKVQGQEGSIVHFKIKKTTPLRKLMNAYCERMGYQPMSVRFIFDGNNVHDTHTPASLEMEENDTIEVFQAQTGGF